MKKTNSIDLNQRYSLHLCLIVKGMQLETSLKYQNFHMISRHKNRWSTTCFTYRLVYYIHFICSSMPRSEVDTAIPH